MPVTLLDLIVLGVILLSALLAMVRGFTREVLSIASWAAAAAATIYFRPDVRDWARTQISLEPAILADVIAGASIFLITLLLVSLLTMRLSDFILDSRVGPFDRALGFAYGAGRGFLLAIIAFLSCSRALTAHLGRQLRIKTAAGRCRTISPGHVAGRPRSHHLEAA
jgi:membrane protein required for colicin V production